MRTLLPHRPSAVRIVLAFVIALAWDRAASAQQPSVDPSGAPLTPSQAAAAKPPAPVVAAPSYGVSAPTSYTLGPCDAGVRDDTHTYAATNCEAVVPVFSVVGTEVAFPLHLPTGALITAVTVNYFDNMTGGGANPSFGLHRTSPTGGLELVLAAPPPEFGGGNNSVTATPASPIQVDNSYAYAMLANLHREDASHYHAVYSIEIHYVLQVSPAPPVATFTDVPVDNPVFRYVEALAASGITAGCGGGNFCPNNPLTRGQMAVFLSKALGLHFPN